MYREAVSADVRNLPANTDSLTCTRFARTITHENPQIQTDRQTDRESQGEIKVLLSSAEKHSVCWRPHSASTDSLTCSRLARTNTHENPNTKRQTDR